MAADDQAPMMKLIFRFVIGPAMKLFGLSHSLYDGARPAIEALGDHGARPRGVVYRGAYGAFSLLAPVIRALGGGTSNSEIGRAMIVPARDEVASTTLSSSEINEMATRAKSAPLGRRHWRTVAVLALVCLAGGAVTVLDGACASMGSSPERARLERIKASPQWSGERFENKRENVTDLFAGAEASAHQVPEEPLPALRRQRADYAEPPASGLRVTWLGHSTMTLSHAFATDTGK